MSIKNHKKLIGKIVIVISLIIVILTTYMVFTTQYDDMYTLDNVEWNGINIALLEGLTVDKQTDNTLKLVGGYGRHDVEANKTTDYTRYNKYIADGDAGLEHVELEFNETHLLMMSKDYTYGAVVPYSALDNESLYIGKHLEVGSVINGDLRIKGNATIYEFSCPDGEFLMTLLMSANVK